MLQLIASGLLVCEPKDAAMQGDKKNGDRKNDAEESAGQEDKTNGKKKDAHDSATQGSKKKDVLIYVRPVLNSGGTGFRFSDKTSFWVPTGRT